MTKAKTPTAVSGAAGASHSTCNLYTPQNEPVKSAIASIALVTVFDTLVTTSCPAALWDPMERQLAGLGTTCRLSAALQQGGEDDRSLVPYFVVSPAPTEIVRQIPRLLKQRSKDGRPGLAEVLAHGFRVLTYIRIVDIDTVPLDVVET